MTDVILVPDSPEVITILSDSDGDSDDEPEVVVVKVGVANKPRAKADAGDGGDDALSPIKLSTLPVALQKPLDDNTVPKSWQRKRKRKSAAEERVFKHAKTKTDFECLLDSLSVDTDNHTDDDDGPPQLTPDLTPFFADNQSVTVTRSLVKIEFKNGLEIDLHSSLWGSLSFGELQLQCTLFSDRGVYRILDAYILLQYSVQNTLEFRALSDEELFMIML
jgi:hypothetical protein